MKRYFSTRLMLIISLLIFFMMAAFLITLITTTKNGQPVMDGMSEDFATQLEQIYRITAPELTKDELKTKESIVDFLTSEQTIPESLIDDFAVSFIKCTRFNTNVVPETIEKVSLYLEAKTWIKYLIVSSANVKYYVTIDNNYPYEVKSITNADDDTLLYVNSIP